jgi:spermidine dehydrogenase
MDRNITRRDFLNGVSLAVGSSLLPAKAKWLEAFGLPESPFAPEKDPGYYPPTKTGLRGDHDGSWETAHAMRDGKRWDNPAPDREAYDLVVVGGGISGLAAAYFYRQAAGPTARILILENHDDFGGHAKRNEFRSASRTLIGYGGTQSIASPHLYSPQAKQLLEELGVDVKKFYRYYDRDFEKQHGLSRAIFFDKETFGEDKLVTGRNTVPPDEFLAKTPLGEQARRDFIRLSRAKVDYLPGKTIWEKKVLLARTSYKDYLLNYVKVDPQVATLMQKSTYGLYGVGIDAVPAGDCAGLHFPGFQGMDLSGPPGPGLGLEITRQDQKEPYIFHFPDGNASLARLLVRSLIPAAAPGDTMEDIVTARFDYANLDSPASPVRIRLNSTVVRARNLGDPAAAKEVEIEYVRGGEARSIRAPACILACWNMVIPYLCPEMSEAQKQGLAYGVKVPLVYTNVQISNWTSFKNLGASEMQCPGSCYFEEVTLDFPVSIGNYRFPANPEDSCVLHLQHVPCKPGLPARDQQVAGRWELFTTKYETYERNIREQLARVLGGGGFDPARDIQAITVNRWPHGYAYEYNSLFDPDFPPDQQPCVIGRQRFGRISIANSDAGAFAYTNEAIDQAYRAVGEVMKRG